MRTLFAVAVAALTAAAQPARLTLDEVLGFAFPSELTASPVGGRVAWISNLRGVRNVMVAEPPAYRARKLTSYSADDGQELQQLRWLPDGSGVVYVRGGSANPGLNPAGVAEEIWVARMDGAGQRKLGQGSSPAVSPKADRVAFVRGGQVWWATLDGKTPAAPAFQARGAAADPQWSPNGSRLAFTSVRGDHSLIGVYDWASGTLRYLDPGTDDDSEATWSPDGRTVAFIRIRSNGLRPVRQAQRVGQPWSIRAASAETGEGREVWRAAEGPGSVFRGLGSDQQLLWTLDGHIVFPWEGDGWTHLYSIPAAGGKALLLTPGRFEVEQAALAAGGRDVVYSSNQDDIDRRHIWRVPAAGGIPVAITSGTGIECRPAPAGDGGAVAFLASDAKRPMHPAIRLGQEIRDIDPVPQGFPVERMVEPRQVVFPSADGLEIHAQLFLPPSAGQGRRPAIVFFHGGPRRQMLLGWHPMYYYSNAYALNQYLANAGYVVLSVNFRSGIGYGLDFREAPHYGASGGSDYNDVQGAGVFLRSRADVDPARVGVWGGSYGGYLTAMALARASDLFKAGVDFHGVHNWATELNIPAGAPDYEVAFESSPLAFATDWRSPVLLIQGDDDRDVQFNQTVRLAYALRDQKVDMEELILPDEVHDFLLYRSWRKAYEATVDFFARKLK